jgi:hypothetical protein
MNIIKSRIKTIEMYLFSMRKYDAETVDAIIKILKEDLLEHFKNKVNTYEEIINGDLEIINDLEVNTQWHSDAMTEIEDIIIDEQNARMEIKMNQQKWNREDNNMRIAKRDDFVEKMTDGELLEATDEMHDLFERLVAEKVGSFLFTETSKYLIALLIAKHGEASWNK